MAMTGVDASLELWPDVSAGSAWPTLLIGNGVSINIWKGFQYPALFEQAGLDEAARKVFAAFGTEDFEGVLDTLWRARTLLDAVGQDTYAEVQRGLLDAVRAVHVPWGRVPPAVYAAIGRELETYERVFTLNYDLLTYWGILAKGRAAGTISVDDFFRPPKPFDPDEPLTPGHTALWFVHGALHLWQNSVTGNIGKWTSSQGNLLRDLPEMYADHPGRQPLFVSEGSAAQKRETIGRSRYLRRAFAALREDRGPAVVLGTRLSEPDEHIAATLRERERLAIGVRRASPEQVVAAKAQLVARLGGRTDLVFFDAATHPLGNADWHVDP
jgi:hypothetical protein